MMQMLQRLQGTSPTTLALEGALPRQAEPACGSVAVDPTAQQQLYPQQQR
jgi:hypothetical protein